MTLSEHREEYHRQICESIVRTKTGRKGAYPNFADGSNSSSIQIATAIIDRLGHPIGSGTVKEQTAGGLFELVTERFVARTFELLKHLRPGKWSYGVKHVISDFDQFEHLATIEGIIKRRKELATALGSDYIVKPDIVVARWPVSDDELNQGKVGLDESSRVASLAPLRERNQHVVRPILHASISCKWTIRSDRSQNTRTEALNLIRNRKGPLPHIAAVTAEPLPTRLAALALGTGDLDCVYHFAL